MKQKIGIYRNGGRVVNGILYLRVKKALIMLTSKMFTLKNVGFKDPKYDLLLIPSLQYDVGTRDFYFRNTYCRHVPSALSKTAKDIMI